MTCFVDYTACDGYSGVPTTVMPRGCLTSLPHSGAALRVAPLFASRKSSEDSGRGKGIDITSAAVPKTLDKVLLVEDNFLIAIDMANALRDRGIDEIEIASGNIEAGRVLDESTVSFAVLDVNLGARGEKSYDIAQRLLDEGVPFVFATGYGDNTKKFPQFSGIKVLTKPVTSDMLWDAVQSLFDPR